MTLRVQAGTFTATGQSGGVLMTHGFNVSLSGTFVATVQPERSFDAGSTWFPFTYSDGSAIAWIAPLSTTLDEPESDVLYRLNCTSYTSGTVTWRVSQ